MDVIGKYVGIILAILLILLFPLQYIAQLQSETMDYGISVHTAEFADTVRHQGYISLEQYEKFIHKLDQTGELYDVAMDISHPVTDQEVTEMAIGDKISDLKAENTSFATHIHTADCYPGFEALDNHFEITACCKDMRLGIYTTYATEDKFTRYTTNKGFAKTINGRVSIACANCFQEHVVVSFRAYEYSLEYNLQVNFYDGNTETCLGKYTANAVYQDTREKPDYSPVYTFISGNPNLQNIYRYIRTANQDSSSLYYPIGDVTNWLTTNIYTIEDLYHRLYLYNGFPHLEDMKVVSNLDPIPEGMIPSIQCEGHVHTGNRKSRGGCYNKLIDGATEILIDYFTTQDTLYSFSDVCSECGPYTGPVGKDGGTYGYGYGGKRFYSTSLPPSSRYTNGQKCDSGWCSGTLWVGGYYSTKKFLKASSYSYGSYYLPLTRLDGTSNYGLPCYKTSKTNAYQLSCGYEGGHYYNEAGEEVFPMCNQVVTSITATSPIQVIDLGGSIATTAFATYLDGHSGIVNCTSNFNPNQLGEQEVTLTYLGLVDNARTTGSKTCKVQVTVRQPYKLTGVTVEPDNQYVPRYTNPRLKVTAHYDNNTSQEVSGYTVTGFDRTILGLQKLTVSYTELGITKTSEVYVTVRNMAKECPDCGTIYELDENDKDPGCPVCNGTIVSITANPSYSIVVHGDPIFLTVEAVYESGIRREVTGWTSDYDPNQIGIQEVKVSYEGFDTYITTEVITNKKNCPECGLEYPLNDDGSDPGCPLCKKVVVSLEVDPSEVTIEKHQLLPITVIAHFKDGHAEEIADWTTNFIADTSGTFDATILYNSAFTTIKVTVLDDGMVECPYCGLNYKFSDSPKGCPVCYYQLTGIEARLRNGGNTVPYKSALNLEIILMFRDEHRESTYEGWRVSGYDPNTLGVQTITVMYEGFSTTLDIEVVDGLPGIVCPNGHHYYLNEDGSDPGCPYCNLELEKENVILYFDTTFTSDILNKLYSGGIYYLKQGDYFTITVTPRNKSLRSNIQKMFFGTNQIIPGKRYTFGGEVIY
jgi:Zn finger protein HypA/HybF involved in hydrogenase expression